MTIKFEWQGAVETESGKAIYTTETSMYELWLPNLAKARQLEMVLRDVFAEGRRVGHAEMKRAVSDAMRLMKMVHNEE